MALAKKTQEPASSPAVITINKKASSVMAGANGVLIDLKSKEEVEKALKDIIKRNKKRSAEILAKDRLTTSEIEEGKKIRAEYREARYTLQNLRDSNKKVLNAMKSGHEMTIAELIAIVSPSEDEMDAKIKGEEDRKAFEKQEAERKERERKEAIEVRIASAATDFEVLINNAKKSKNWDLFDALVESFEEGLDSLEEYAFEGQELLDEVAIKKTEAIASIEEAERLEKQAAEQAEKDREQNERQQELDRQAAKRDEDKRRTKEMFSIGFMFNGEDFVKGESSYTEASILDADKEKYDAILKLWKDQIQAEAEAEAEAQREAEAAEEAKAKRVENWNKLTKEAGELELDIIHEVTSEEVEDFQIKDLEKRIADFKTEQGRIAEEERIAAEAAKAIQIKEDAWTVVNGIEDVIETLQGDIIAENFTDNEVVLGAVKEFYETINVALNKLRKTTNYNLG